MKRFIALSAACMAFSVFGEDLMYWMVDSTAAGIEFFGANLYAVTTEGGVQSAPQLVQSQYNMSEGGDGQWTYAEATKLQNPAECPTGTGEHAFMTDIAPYGVQSAFYVELVNLSGEVVGTWLGDYMTRDDLFAIHAVDGFTSQTAPKSTFESAWVADSFSPIPEPTGGLLFLLGGGMLLLRRPRKAALRA